jgi:flagellar hook assembly protein FlgD
LPPKQLELLPNVPNPFNPTTRISFALPTEGNVQLAIYDARGTLVRVLIDKSFPSGHHDVVWDGRDGKGSPVSSGVYLCRLEHEADFRTRKIVLIK